jgi:D-amino-acid dehydrogenase
VNGRPAYDAIVVGGGLLGLATAYHLVQNGAATLLVDRRDAGRATDAGAGILSPETNTRDPDPWIQLALRAAAYYPSFIAALGADGAGDTGYARCGLLLVAVSDEEEQAFAGARRRILERRDRHGHPPETDLHEVPPADARRMFPPLAPVRGALYHRGAARVDGRLLARAIGMVAERHGLTARHGAVERLVLAGGRVVGAVVDGETVHAGSVAIAGGAWSQAFADQLGVPVAVAPQRGQIIHLTRAGASTEGWPIVNAFRGHYLVPWPDGRVAAGATRETGSGFDSRLTASGVREVLSEALRVAPGLAEWSIREMRVGLRPLSADGLPLLGAVPGIENVCLVTGHGPSGLQLGPYSGKLAAEVMLGRRPEMDLRPFSVARFGPR